MKGKGKDGCVFVSDSEYSEMGACWEFSVSEGSSEVPLHW